MLSEQGAPARRFPDFEAALHGVRRAPQTQSGTIEAWERGQYVCCLPPGAWPNCRVADEAAAQFLLSTAGPVFWAVVLSAALVASLGWRVVLL